MYVVRKKVWYNWLQVFLIIADQYVADYWRYLQGLYYKEWGAFYLLIAKCFAT